MPPALHRVIRLLSSSTPSPPTVFASLLFCHLASNMSNFESKEQNPSQNINSGNVNGNYNNTWSFSRSTNCGNVDNSHHSTYNYGVTDERRDILEWLSPLAPGLRHREVTESRVGGVGNWLLEKEEFIHWNIGEDGVASPILFCYGDPGAGKTRIRYGLTFSWENGGD